MLCIYIYIYKCMCYIYTITTIVPRSVSAVRSHLPNIPGLRASPAPPRGRAASGWRPTSEPTTSGHRPPNQGQCPWGKKTQENEQIECLSGGRCNIYIYMIFIMIYIYISNINIYLYHNQYHIYIYIHDIYIYNHIYICIYIIIS